MTAGTASAPARGPVRVLRLALLIVATALLATSCAAGQHAQTVEVKGSIDGSGGVVGQTMLVQGVAIHAPGGGSYRAGSSAQLAVTIVNNGHRPDTLTNVTSSAFTGWGIFPNAQATTTSSTGGDTGITIGANSAQRLGLVNTGASAQASPRTVVLFGLSKSAAPLYPGDAVTITFHFANAGTGTFRVPVQIAQNRPAQLLPGGSSSAAPAG